MDIVRKGILLVVALLFVVNSSYATDGYFLTGYGVKQQGQGGAGVAFPGDSLAGATNPAGLLFVGDRIDFGLTLFRPTRYGIVADNGGSDGNVVYDANRVKNFFLPDLGYSHLLRPNLALGVALYGNGGMNTSYTVPIPLLGTSRGGVDLQQLFVSPTLAYKVDKHNSLGLAVNIAYQRFAAEGLQNFAAPSPPYQVSSDPAHVTNTGHANSYGAGVRVGWLGELTHYLNVGATFQTRTYASRFDRYAGLFAEQGGFDIPANVAGGVAVKIHPKATILFDAERIFYGQVKSIANLGSNQALLGSDNGPGFGWHDITAIKTGIVYKWNSSLTLRGGYNHSGVPFDNTQTFFNLLAPAVVQNHLHLGATWTSHSGKEISLAYVHAFENQVNGVNSIAPSFGGGNANLRMYQNSISIGFGWDRNKK